MSLLPPLALDGLLALLVLLVLGLLALVVLCAIWLAFVSQSVSTDERLAGTLVRLGNNIFLMQMGQLDKFGVRECRTSGTQWKRKTSRN